MICRQGGNSLLTQNERETIRVLAQQYMEISTLQRQDETKQLWLNLNRCQMERPMVVIDQIPWHEMDVDGELHNSVQEPYWRNVETELRRTLYKWKYMSADMVINPYIQLPRPVTQLSYGVEVEEETLQSDTKNDVVSHKFVSQLQQLEDLEKIQTPKVRPNVKLEERIRQEAEVIFAGIAPFVMTGVTLHVGVWDFLTQWMGIENIYIDLIERPEFLHKAMDKLTTATVELIEQMDEDGMFDAYTNMCHCSYTFSDDLPTKGCDRNRPAAKDVWAFGLAQLFTSVSPQVTAEFEVPYMKRIFPYFGAIYYGCCDRLDDRLDIITQMPNIRKISCSPWSNREVFAEKLPKGYVMSSKPTPAFLAGGAFDEDAVRHDIQRTIRVAKEYDVPLEMILKDISTVNYEPQRLWRWAQIAIEEVKR